MRYWLLIFGLFCFSALAAQTPEAALQKFADTYPQEKVVLLFSKPEYVAGETIYFKAHVLTGYEPSLLSTNLYTELYDREKKLLQKQMIPLIGGSGNGSFALPASLAEDVYYIRAYTQWMRNFDEAFFYLRPLPVYNPYSSQSLRPKPVQWTARAVIEGGQLIENSPANVAVRLTATGLLPSQWSGELLEEGTPAPVADLTVYNTEIGQVRFIPHEGKTYKIVVKDKAGKREELLLPPVQKSGILLQAGVSAGLLRYSLSFKNIPTGGQGFKLVAGFNNEPAVTATISKATDYVTGTFNLKELPAGVLHLTLFSAKDEPLTERLFFLHQDSLPLARLTVSTDTLSFDAKGYNHWQVGADSLYGESLSVTVADTLLGSSAGFLSAVYLTSDFSAPVQEADWYFTEVTPEKKAALDALLLTETWNRYRWVPLLQNRLPAIRYQPDAYLRYTGTISKGKKPQPQRDMNLILRAADSSFSFVPVISDSAGQFVLDNLFFRDSLAVYYQPNKRKLLESDLQISFTTENRFAPLTGTFPYSALTAGARTPTDAVPLVVQKSIAQRASERLLGEKTNVLKEVVVTAKARNVTEELEKQLTSGLFSGGASDVFDFVNQNQTNVAGYNNILEWLQGRVAGLSVFNSGGTWTPQIRNGPVQLFLNETNVTPDVISSIAPFDIALVKVYKGNFTGSLGAGSAIAIYTRRGGMPTQNNTPSLPSAVLKGYQPFTLPSMPDYSLAQAREVSDSRTVLYYTTLPQPDDGPGKATIRFYNNDTSKQFRLLITGFAPNGRLVYVNRLIETRTAR